MWTDIFIQWLLTGLWVGHGYRMIKSVWHCSYFFHYRYYCLCIALDYAWLSHLIGDKAPSTAHDSSEVARAFSQLDGSWCLNSSLFWSVGFSVHEEATGG